MAAEQVQQLLAAVEQLNRRIVDLEQRAQDNGRNRTGLIDKGIQPGVFDGVGYHNWAEDMLSIVSAKNDKIGDAMRWAGTKNDAITTEEATLNHPQVNEGELRELYVYLQHYLIGEPRIISKGANGNGLETWRRLKGRYDPVTETSQVNVLLQVLQPVKAKNLRDLLPCIEKWD